MFGHLRQSQGQLYDFRIGGEIKRTPVERAGFVVAQRISSVMRAHRIVVLENGRVAGLGTHAELLEHSAVYREIVASQMSLDEVA